MKLSGYKVKTFLPPLSRDREDECLRRILKGDKEAKDELILHNMRLVAHVTKKYAATEEEARELISIGTIGLIKAVGTYDISYENRFATYAVRCIENEILMYYRSKKKQRTEVSLFDPIGVDNEGNQIALMDVLVNDKIDIEGDVENVQYIDKIKANIYDVLSEREAYIVIYRYGLFGKPETTQKEIARRLNISRSYVSRIEKRALIKLKNLIENR